MRRYSAATMGRRLGTALATLLTVAALAGCGGAGGHGYGCQGSTCTATFDGTGSQDISELDRELDLRDINGNTTALRVDGAEENFKVGETKTVDGLRITLESVDGDSVTFHAEPAT